MKKKLIPIVFLICLMQDTLPLFAQDVNWRALNPTTKHLASVYFGADYSSYYGSSYGYIFKTKYTPIVAGAEFTIPFGKQMVDDWRSKTSLQAELWKHNNFSLALKPSFILRRYASPIAKIYNVGADVSVTFGYMKAKWGIVALVNYDKSIASHLKHDLLKEYYPGIKDGWYGAAGGNFKFGARIHYSLKSWNAFLTVGKHYGQNFKDNPTLPFFAELSVQRQFGRK